jgi:hypothetical protein
VTACCVAADESKDEFGVVHTWSSGPEVVFLSNPVADPVSWSASVRDELLELGYQVTAFEHRPEGLDWRSAVGSVVGFLAIAVRLSRWWDGRGR